MIIKGVVNRKRVKAAIWVTDCGRRIPLYRMTTHHILSTIECFNGNGAKFIPEDYLGGKEKWLKIFNDELIKRNFKS